MFRIERSLVVWAVAISASAACTTANHQTPATAPAREPAPNASAAAVSHRPWRPLHKGGADLSTGVYVREDDDLVVNTPLPIVLRRTYNSGDQYSRQFGVDAMHPGVNAWMLLPNRSMIGTIFRLSLPMSVGTSSC